MIVEEPLLAPEHFQECEFFGRMTISFDRLQRGSLGKPPIRDTASAGVGVASHTDHGPNRPQIIPLHNRDAQAANTA